MERLFKISVVAVFMIIVIGIDVKAQSDLGLYGLRVVPQSNFSNPAFIPDGKLIIGLPFISSISSTTYSSSFSFNDIFVTKDGSDSLYLNLSSVISKTSENNFITEYIENDIIYLGFKLKNNFLNVGIRNRMYSRAMYSSDLVKLFWNGNGNYINEKLDLSRTSVNHDHFLSYYVGFGFMIGNNVSLGIRANLNQGLSSIQTTNNQLFIETVTHDQKVFSINANTGFSINTSGLSTDSTENDKTTSEYIFNFKNIGFSVDFGADFRISERFKLNFSVIDLGFINWKSDLKSYENTSDYIEFTGIYVDINTTEDLFEAYADSIAELIDINEFEQEFKTHLPTRIFGGLEYYSLDKTNRLSFVFSGTFLKNYFSPAFSVGYDKTVSKHFTFKVNYTYLKYAPLNIGTGLVFNFKPFQFYFLTDNILSAFYWSGQQYINFRVGINLVFPEQNSIKKGEPVFTE